jgi:hypothetical protein
MNDVFLKPPRFLLGAALLFWGWQSQLLVVGALMAVVFESARWTKTRWELSNEDLCRIWDFCSILLLAAAVLAFSSSDSQGDARRFFQSPNFFTARNLSNASSRAAAAWLRWLPMVFFLFAAAHAFGAREGIPLETFSWLLRRRIKQARKLGLPPPVSHSINVSFPYFTVCLFAASVHAGQDSRSYFWGACALVGWALWTCRSSRFTIATWAAALAVAIGSGYFGQQGVGQLQHYIENFNGEWLANWSHSRSDPSHSKTALGAVGRLKQSGRIVIRIKAEANTPALLLREATYYQYKSETWYADPTGQGFDSVREELTNKDSYVLSPGNVSLPNLNIACYLSGGNALLPLPLGCTRLDNCPVFSLSKNRLGTVLASGPGVLSFDARYGSGQITDSPADTNQDLSVPSREKPALEQVLSALNVSGQTREQKLRAIAAFFLNNFTYQLWQEPPPASATNESPLTRFLLHTRAGHCEYFATATVLLLREAGIPARYAVGYSAHEKSGRKITVRQRDAHAWCQVWNEKTKLWQDFDTTPASWIAAEEERASPLQFLSDLWSGFWFQVSKIWWNQGQLREYVLWALIPILALLLYQIIRRGKRRHSRTTGPALAVEWPGLDSEFYELEKQLIARGFPRGSGETLSDWLKRVASESDMEELRSVLQRLLQLHYQYRFDPLGLTPESREELRRDARHCREKLEAT